MDFSVIDLELVVTLLLLLLIGMGPKIALVPFLDKTKGFEPERQRAVGKRMVKTAVATAFVLLLTGGLLMRLLHISSGAVAVAGGIILALLAIKMAVGSGEEVVEEADLPVDHEKIAIYPLAVPYLLNPVGITVLIIASSEIGSIASAGLVAVLVALVGALDYLVFTNIDKLARRLNPTTMVVSEVVFGVLLTAVAVQLAVSGLGSLGIIEPIAAH